MTSRMYPSIVVLTVLAAVCMEGRASAQACRPTTSTKDKLTKAQVDLWAQEVSGTSFASRAVLNSTNLELVVAIGRMGDTNRVHLTLTNEYDKKNVGRALVENRYEGRKGDEFFIGFKEGGAPVKFTVDEASNETKVKGVLTSLLINTVVLAAEVADEELPALRETLGTRQPDAIRVVLASETIDKSISDGNGRKLAEKFACFFAFAEQQGFLK